MTQRWQHETRRVWRWSAALLLALFCGFLLGPVSMALRGEDASLPACCRRNGKHHCAMSMEEAAAMVAVTRVAAAPMRCPAFPVATGAGAHVDLGLGTDGVTPGALAGGSAMGLRAEVWVAATVDRGPHGRGPPAGRNG